MGFWALYRKYTEEEGMLSFDGLQASDTAVQCTRWSFCIIGICFRKNIIS